MKKHPEQRDGEIYLGNTTESGFNGSSWISKRMGETARNADGRTIARGGLGEGLFPWFIARSEVESTIRSIPADAPNGAEKIRTFQSMLSEDAT